jgi:hypothetical protein
MSKNIKDVCTNLHKNYDASILKNSSDIIQNVFKNTVSGKIKGYNENTNKTLIELIYNYYNNKKPNYEYITGPISLSYQVSTKYNKRIYIFGEYHPKKTECDEIDSKIKSIKIYDYLYYLFKSTDVFIDFYLEYQSFPANYDPYNLIREEIIMRKMYIMIDKCINPEKKCNFNTIRAHFIDTRYYKGFITSPIGKLQREIHLLIKNKKILLSLDEENTNIVNTLIYYNDNIILMTNYMLNIINNIEINKKEIKKSLLNEDEFKKIIKKYISFRIKNNVQDLSKNLIIANKSSKYTDYLDKILYNIFLKLKALDSVGQDIYTISRIFRNFNVKNNIQPVEPNNIVIYVGDQHAILLRKILNDLGFITINNIKSINGTKCLDMKNFEQPFFN